MGAVEIDSAQPWRVQDESPQALAELANTCGNLWGAAMGLYFSDCAAAMRGSQYGDKGEALSDLTSRDMPLLRHLCCQCGADVERVSAGMIAGLDAGLRFEPRRMHRAAPERAEDYGCWSKTTRGKTAS